MKRLMSKLILISVFAGGSVFAVAQEAGPDDRHDRGTHSKGKHHEGLRGGFGNPPRMLERMTRHLDLDDTQAQQVSNIFTAAKPEIDALRENFRDNQRAMGELKSDDPDYNAALQNLSTANADVAAQMTLLQGRVRADIEALLTPAQLETFRNRSDRRQRWHGAGADSESI